MTQKPIPVNEITGIWSYLSTVDWSERWLWGLGIFHLLCLTVTLLTCRHSNIQIVVFLIYLGLVYFSEQINELAATHWRSFAQQQYFDSKGLFISIVFSSPLLFNCLAIVVLWMYNSFQIMIKLKRAKLREQARENAEIQKDATDEEHQEEKKEK